MGNPVLGNLCRSSRHVRSLFPSRQRHLASRGAPTGGYRGKKKKKKGCRGGEAQFARPETSLFCEWLSVLLLGRVRGEKKEL